MASHRSQRRRALLLGTGFLLLIVMVIASISLVVRPAATGVPLDPRIPNEQALIVRGLSGVPSPGQSVSPVAVDRVVTDGAATYVQFHMVWSAGRFPALAVPTVSLSDDTGTAASASYGTNINLSPSDWVPPLPAWFPWHLPVLVRGVMMLGPLAPTARAAVLHFSSSSETVRVPLTLTVLRHVRAYSGPLVQRNGLQLRVAAARDTGLVLDFSPFGIPRGVMLTDARGRVVPLRAMFRACSGSGFADVRLACRWVWAYPPPRRGARLTLTIRSFAADSPSADPPGAVVNTVGAGPWLLPVVFS